MVRRENSLLRRDLRLAYVLFVWSAFAFAFFYFFSGGIRFHNAATAPPQQQQTQAESEDEIYTGSIIKVPRRGDKCWQMMLDNRTGEMWETGYVSCYAAVRHLAENRRKGALSSIRIQSISNAFRGSGE